MAKYKEIVIRVQIRPEAILGAIIRDTLTQRAADQPEEKRAD